MLYVATCTLSERTDRRPPAKPANQGELFTHFSVMFIVLLSPLARSLTVFLFFFVGKPRRSNVNDAVKVQTPRPKCRVPLLEVFKFCQVKAGISAATATSRALHVARFVEYGRRTFGETDLKTLFAHVDLPADFVKFLKEIPMQHVTISHICSSMTVFLSECTATRCLRDQVCRSTQQRRKSGEICGKSKLISVIFPPRDVTTLQPHVTYSYGSYFFPQVRCRGQQRPQAETLREASRAKNSTASSLQLSL